MIRFLKGCWQRRWIRRSVWTLFTLLTLIVLLITWMDWSGARQLRSAEAMLAKEGQTLDSHAIAPDLIPDAENFCAIPLLKDIALVIDNDSDKGEPGKKRARLKDACLPPWNDGARMTMTDSALGKRADMKQWAEALRKNVSPSAPKTSGDAAREILAVFSKQDTFYKELAAGLDRPAAQWTPAWKTRELTGDLVSLALPHLDSANQLNHALAVRAIAAAHAGDAAQAHESLQIMARINQACMGEPFLIGMLVAGSGATQLANATWEICDAQIGTAEDFERLESALAGIDFRQTTVRAVRAELIFGVGELRYFASESPMQRRTLVKAYSNIGDPPSFETQLLDNIMCWLPSGFFEANAAVFADREYTYLVKPIRDGGWHATLASAHDFDAEVHRMKGEILTHPSYVSTALYAPAFSGVLGRPFYAQALVNLALIACALERYRIEKGSYPESLDEVRFVGGKPLPLDIMTGKPIGYRKTPNGKYALWSVARNGKDHGGQRVIDKKNPEKTRVWKESYEGDWVWDFPEK